MRFSVSLVAHGDREIELDEVVALADEVAVHGGIASGFGAMEYGAQLIVDAPGSDEAVDAAMAIFSAAVRRAGLPDWPIARAETISEDDDFADLDEQ